jgi:hypothetical protein
MKRKKATCHPVTMLDTHTCYTVFTTTKFHSQETFQSKWIHSSYHNSILTKVSKWTGESYSLMLPNFLIRSLVKIIISEYTRLKTWDSFLKNLAKILVLLCELRQLACMPLCWSASCRICVKFLEHFSVFTQHCTLQTSLDGKDA